VLCRELVRLLPTLNYIKLAADIQRALSPEAQPVLSGTSNLLEAQDRESFPRQPGVGVPGWRVYSISSLRPQFCN